jgi:hypothetical protein
MYVLVAKSTHNYYLILPNQVTMWSEIAAGIDLSNKLSRIISGLNPDTNQ